MLQTLKKNLLRQLMKFLMEKLLITATNNCNNLQLLLKLKMQIMIVNIILDIKKTIVLLWLPK